MKKFKQYGINRSINSKIRMDEVPVSLALAQAAKETDGVLQDLHKRVMLCLVSGLGLVKD